MGFNSNKLLGTLILVLAPLASATTWYVNGVSGSDSNTCESATTPCKTIGHGIALASSGDTIKVAAATYTENLTISINLKLIGSGASTTILDGGAINTVVTIYSTVTLSGLTIQDGNAFQAGGIYNAGTLTINNSTISNNFAQFRYRGFGGGIYNYGGLTINNSTVSGNGAILGGGIYNFGTVTISRSTISGNDASDVFGDAQGGGIYNEGTLTLNNSTLSGNSANAPRGLFCHAAYGGGIYSASETLTVNNSTLSGNYAENCYGVGSGGGIYGNVSLQNTIVANSSYGGNCDGTMTSKGYNLSSDGTCNFNNTGDLNNTDPMLGLLQNNGGPTQTQALLSGSPAIDAGNPNGCTDGNGKLLKTDQRGLPRPDKEDAGGCDIGAYERQTD